MDAAPTAHQCFDIVTVSEVLIDAQRLNAAAKEPKIELSGTELRKRVSSLYSASGHGSGDML